MNTLSDDEITNVADQYLFVQARVANNIEKYREDYRRAVRFRSGFINIPAPNKAIEPVHKIMMVGAEIDFREGRCLSPNDEHVFERTHRELIGNGLRLANDFQIAVTNIRPRFGGRDFFDETEQADLIIFCNLYNPPQREMDCKKEDPESLLLTGVFSVSARQRDPGAWHDKSVELGARYLAVHVYDDADYHTGHILEINHNHFLDVPRPQFGKMTNQNNRDALTLLRRLDAA